MNKSNSNAHKESLKALLQRQDITNIYFNEFTIGVSKSDLFMVLARNGNPECILNASHITVKNLIEALQQATSEKGENEQLIK